MFYIIEDTNSAVYKELAALRDKELEYRAENLAIAKEVTRGLTWDSFTGYGGGGSFRRVYIYRGFVFKEVEKVDPKTWRLESHTGAYVPNLRTKKGKEINQKLGTQKSTFYTEVLKPLGVKDYPDRFTTPYMNMAGGIILLKLDAKHIPTAEGVIEVTSVEFKSLLGLPENFKL